MNKKGFVLSIVFVFMLILIVIATSFVVLTNNEVRTAQQQVDVLKAFFLAEAGIEKALYELSKDATYTGETASLGEGVYSVSLIPLNGQVQIDSKGFIPNEVTPRVWRQVRVIAERPINPITADSAVTAMSAGKNMEVKGNAIIDGKTQAGVKVPRAQMVSKKGSAEILGTPDILENPSPTFEEIFGMTEEEMKALATVYTDPPNNVPNPANGVTWIEGDAQYTQSGWIGQGVLIVTGNLRLTGGVFKGVIYVMGSVDTQAGNAYIKGALMVAGDGDFAGTTNIVYDIAEINGAGKYYPYKVVSWEEIR